MFKPTLKSTFPGLGTAMALFGAYLVFDAVRIKYFGDSHGHHVVEHHTDGHHETTHDSHSNKHH